MKHNYDEPTMQAAIDAACQETKVPTGFQVLALRGRDSDWEDQRYARLHLLKSALDLLPEPPPPVVDGKTPGQVCHESMYNTPEWKWLLAGDKAACESAASAVLAAFGNKPAEIPWTEWHGGECPLRDEEVEEWGCKLRENFTRERVTHHASYWRWKHLGLNNDIIAYRVTKWREGFGPGDWKAKCEEAIMALNISKACHEKAEAELAQANEEVENRREAILKAAAQIDELKVRADRWFNQAKAENEKYLKAVEQIGQLQQSQLSTLHPIAEAGEAPAGCLRIYTTGGEYPQHTADADSTHFADIRLPESHVEAPADVIHDGGEVFQAVQWTPTVGDVVTLKS